MSFNFGEDVKLDSGFEPLPAGWYQACITDAIYKPTKANNGEYLSVTFTVTGTEYTGRKIFSMYNLVNANPTAVKIALQQMKSLLIETGCDETMLNSVSKEQLIQLIMNKEVGIRLKVEISEQYGDKNVIVGYKMTKSQPAGSTPAF